MLKQVQHDGWNLSRHREARSAAAIQRALMLFWMLKQVQHDGWNPAIVLDAETSSA
jgi:hypothetical protein